MTIGIRCRGKLNDETDFVKLVNTVIFHAGQYDWPAHEYANPDEILLRTAAGADGRLAVSEYRGPVRGVMVFPPRCESLMFVFDAELVCQWSCRTGDGSVETHVRVIELFDMIAPRFAFLEIEDDGGYWAHRDRRRLERTMARRDDAGRPEMDPETDGEEPPSDVAV